MIFVAMQSKLTLISGLLGGAALFGLSPAVAQEPSIAELLSRIQAMETRVAATEQPASTDLFALTSADLIAQAKVLASQGRLRDAWWLLSAVHLRGPRDPQYVEALDVAIDVFRGLTEASPFVNTFNALETSEPFKIFHWICSLPDREAIPERIERVLFDQRRWVVSAYATFATHAKVRDWLQVSVKTDNGLVERVTVKLVANETTTPAEPSVSSEAATSGEAAQD